MTGFISIWSPEKFVHHLYVDPKYQGRGVATILCLLAE
ncbi:MAG: GNAT family N-acetyltransferase [bacterium]|nr:GNAT family N-acetyltransferase [Gammaproteobacteria bacterium]HIL82316.1 GNAT family N-acetyltransferase [Pseudomonadales bacterium]